MSMRYKGSRLSATANTPTSLTASGAWTLQQQMQANGTSTWPFVRDPQFNYVTMLLHGDGSAGANVAAGAGATPTVTAFNTDASTNNFNVTINGDARSNNFTPYQGNGYYGVRFNGSSDFLTTPQTTSLNIGTGTFTVEAWVYLNGIYSSGGSAVINLGNGANGGGPYSGWGLIIDYDAGSNTAYPAWYRYDGTVTQYTSSTSLNVGKWYHLAVARDSSNNIAIWVNGSRVYSGTSTVSFNNVNSDPLNIGKRINGSGNSPNWLNGYLSNGRVVIGSNVYDPTQSTITVPTTPLTAVTNTQLLFLQSNQFIDNSSAARAITVAGGTPQVAPAVPFTLPSSVATYGSAGFGGTSGSYLGTAGSTATAMGTGDFTWEVWVYVVGASGYQTFIESRSNPNGSTDGFFFGLLTGTLTPSLFTTSSLLSSSVNVVANSWNHVAATRSSGTMQIWVNGVSGGSVSNSTNLTNQSVSIGGNGSLSLPINGYISNARLVKGTAVYTAAFTPPTSPLTAITNTQLLTTQYNGGGNNSGFKDSSQNNFVITRSGNTTQGTFAPYGSNWSNNFNGTNAYFTVANNTALNLSSGNFTIESWIYWTGATANSQIINKDGVAGSSYPSWSLELNGSGYVQGVVGSGNGVSSLQTVTSTTLCPQNSWVHLAFVKNGTTLTLYQNGVSVVSATQTATITDGGKAVYIGYQANQTAPHYFSGYISNLRVVKGTAVYTAAFTPSTTPLTAISGTSLLTCADNRFIDDSANSFALTVNGTPSVQRFSPFANATAYNPATTGGSAYFDGSDYLTATSTSGQLGSGDFTIECWSYLISRVSIYPCIWGNYTSFTTGSLAIFAGHNSGVTTKYNVAINGTFPAIQSTDSIIYNQWTHLALVRSGSTITLYVNGVANGTATSSATLNGTAGVSYIGSAGDDISNGYINGYLSNMRISRSAVYTAAFTPPPAPLTPIASTQLLLSTTNSAILDQSMMNDLETVGNAQISTSVVKYGTASMYFDGSSDRLYEPSNQNFNFGTGDFTIELWANPISQGGHGSTNNDCLIDFRPATGSGAYGTLYIFNSGASVNWYANGLVRITGGTISNGAWTHIAICRSSGSTRLFLNGVQSGSTYADSTNYLVSPIMVGEFNDGTGGGNFYGYLDDLRITKGYARYTTTFTPPTQALPNG